MKKTDTVVPHIEVESLPERVEEEKLPRRLDIIKEFQASGSSTTLENLIAKHGFCF